MSEPINQKRICEECLLPLDLADFPVVTTRRKHRKIRAQVCRLCSLRKEIATLKKKADAIIIDRGRRREAERMLESARYKAAGE